MILRKKELPSSPQSVEFLQSGIGMMTGNIGMNKKLNNSI